MAQKRMMKPGLGQGERRTHPVVWCVAVVCTVIAVAVIVTGVVVFVAYLVIRPSVPLVRVAWANLDNMQNDMAGVLEVHLTIVLRAQNDNAKAHASFSDTWLQVSFQGVPVAILKAGHFDVAKNATLNLPYRMGSAIPLSPSQADQVDLARKKDQISFDLKGHSRARWRVGLIGSVKFWCNLNCRLLFHPSNGTFINTTPCTSRAK